MLIVSLALVALGFRQPDLGVGHGGLSGRPAVDVADLVRADAGDDGTDQSGEGDDQQRMRHGGIPNEPMNVEGEAWGAVTRGS